MGMMDDRAEVVDRLLSNVDWERGHFQTDGYLSFADGALQYFTY